MSRRLLIRIYVPVALAVLTVGLLGLWHSLQYLADVRAQCVGLRAHHTRLDALDARLAPFVEARDRLTVQFGAKTPQAIDALLSEAFPGSTPVLHQTTRMLIPGWQAREVDVRLRNVSGARVCRFVETAETSSMSLRLTRGELLALPGNPGLVDASLELIRIEPAAER